MPGGTIAAQAQLYSGGIQSLHRTAHMPLPTTTRTCRAPTPSQRQPGALPRHKKRRGAHFASNPSAIGSYLHPAHREATLVSRTGPTHPPRQHESRTGSKHQHRTRGAAPAGRGASKDTRSRNPPRPKHGVAIEHRQRSTSLARVTPVNGEEASGRTRIQRQGRC